MHSLGCFVYFLNVFIQVGLTGIVAYGMSGKQIDDSTAVDYRCAVPSILYWASNVYVGSQGVANKGRSLDQER